MSKFYNDLRPFSQLDPVLFSQKQGFYLNLFVQELYKKRKVYIVLLLNLNLYNLWA